MKKIRWIILTAAILLCLGGFSFAAAEEDAEPDEWTVMFYFCGSDLESRHGYASENLLEISGVEFPFDQSVGLSGEYSWADTLRDIGKVNILLETGGSQAWNPKYMSIDLATDALQRWEYYYYPESAEEIKNTHSYKLVETLPLQSMADPETLADFIRWGAETYPARKYALVLWDHGKGAKGILIDELFDDDMMYLYELKEALAGGGVHLDTLILDACLMANIETAWTVKDYADYMVASEEEVPGAGTAFEEWLQALVDNPTLDGRWLAQCVCDMTDIKYTNMEDEKSKSLLTWSVIDLKQIDPLISACGGFLRQLNQKLKDGSPVFTIQIGLIKDADMYGDKRLRMIDFGSALYARYTRNYADPEYLHPIIDALSKAVIHISRGEGRTTARGLSFCFPLGFSDEELDLYARNFPMPDYLALLDATSSTWTAPEEVYTQTERLPEINTIDRFVLKGTKAHTANGMPAVQISGTTDFNYYNLYRLDEKTGETILLGQTLCDEGVMYGEMVDYAGDPMHWPALDGMPCSIDLVQVFAEELLYNIPIQINTDMAMLRCGRTVEEKEDGTSRIVYNVYGVWEGYDDNSTLTNRSVKPLAMLAGQSYCLLYPRDVTTKNGKTAYVKSEEKTMYRSLMIEEITLPAGTYYVEYVLNDAYMRSTKTDRFEIQWDGEKMTFPNGDAWTGSFSTVEDGEM